MDMRRETRVIGIFAPTSTAADPSVLIHEAIAFHHAGAGMVDLDTLPGGPFAGVDDDTIALLIRGMSEAGIPVSLTTTNASLAAVAIDQGVGWIIDPSGTSADRDMIGVAMRPSGVGWAIGPWSMRHSPHRGADTGADAYTEGLLRNLGALLAAGVRSDRIVLNASAGLTSSASDPWRMLNHLDRIAALGCPILIDAPDEMLASMSSDDAADRLEHAAVALAVLAAGASAWGIRTRAAGRIAGTIQRILEPRRSA